MNVLVSNSKNEFTWLRTIVCEVEGGTPELESFFYIDVDKNKKEDLGIICRYPEHRGADCNIARQAKFYSFPDNVKEGEMTESRSKEIEKILYSENVISEKPKLVCTKANFNDAKELKKLLLKNK